jgi:hypothetical protein
MQKFVNGNQKRPGREMRISIFVRFLNAAGKINSTGLNQNDFLEDDTLQPAPSNRLFIFCGHFFCLH